MADSLLTPNPSSLGCSAREYSSDIRKVLNEYQRYKISHLKPGPVKATFSGLLVNLQDNHTTDNIPQGAKTAYTLILRDETGEIIVHLWFAETDYQLFLNHKITIWTTHVCAATSVRASSSGKHIATTPNSTHVFPERNRRCGLSIEANYDPLKYKIDAEMEDFMTLDQFTRQNDGKKDKCTLFVKIRTVGKPVETRCSSPQGSVTRLVVSVEDTSTPNQQTAMLIQQPLVPSFLQLAGKWLVMTNCRMVQGRFLAMSRLSRVMIEPEKELTTSIEPNCDRTNSFLHGMSIHGLSTDAVLLDLFDSNVVPTLTLSGMEALISRDPMGSHQARVHLLISRLAFNDLWFRGMLFYSYCGVCSQARYCNRCDEKICHPDMATSRTRVNPNLIGEIADETGGISCSQDQSRNDTLASFAREPLRYPLLITNHAFAGLVGCRPESLSDDLMFDLEEDETCTRLQSLDNDLDWARVEALLGWFSVESPHLKSDSSSGSASDSYERSKPISEAGTSGQLVLLDATLLVS